ncbi:MAG: type IV pilus assembly protein PilM [Victivallales bacterium]
MPANEFLLCIDIGGDSIKAAEFSYSPTGDMVLEKFAFSEYGKELNGEEDNFPVFATALSDIVSKSGFSAKKVSITISGQNSYIKFVKVPAMVNDEKKIKQIIEFEAKNAIPFSMDEVVWDSQLISSSDDSGEIEAMFVIVKNEEIDKITRILESLGKEIVLIEVAPTACYNAARANGVGDTDCEMILNIGGRCSTLIFIDNGRFFVRIIPIAGHSVTLQISKEFGISYNEAEELKRRHGFVALGGAYEEPDSEVAATVSKIIRNVMTRLHGEVNRSINVYRSQQKGRKPEKLYLAGGSSVMAYTPRFFAEKLRIPVEYLNPFQNIAIAPALDKESLANLAHMFSETIGLAVRHATACPIEVSLVPESMRKLNDFKLKKPYLYASAASLLLCLLVTLWGFSKQLEIAEYKQKIASSFLTKTNKVVSRLKSAEGDFANAQNEYNAAAQILAKQKIWPMMLNESQKVLPDDMWLTTFTLTSNVPTTNNAPRDEFEGGLFAGMGGGRSTPAVSGSPTELTAAKFEGHALIWDNGINELFTEMLSKSKFFKFNPQTETFTSVIDGTMASSFNVSTFSLTSSLQEAYKRDK